MVVSHGFVLEGQNSDELPERLLGCIRTQGMSFAKTNLETKTETNLETDLDIDLVIEM
jgi:hypothetical protein